jgi:hypothetical protein
MPLLLLAGSVFGVLEAANAVKKHFAVKDQKKQLAANSQELFSSSADRLTGRRLATAF